MRWVDVIPGGHDGLTRFEAREVLIRNRMRATAEDEVITHELVHVERGPFPRYAIEREERIVRQITACRLITLDQLADALVWCYDPREVALYLHVEVTSVLARFEALTEEENAWLDRMLDEAELRIP